MIIEKSSSIRTFYGKSRIYKNVFDGVSLGLGFWLAIRIQGIIWEDHLLWIFILSYCLFMLFAEYNEVYLSMRSTSLFQNLRLSVFCWISVMVLLLMVDFLFQVFTDLSRNILICWLFTTSALLVGWRLVWYFFLNFLEDFRILDRNVAIAGGNTLGLRLAETIKKEKWRGERLVGIYEDRQPVDERVRISKNVEVLGNFDDMVADARAQKIDVIYLVLPLRAENRMYEQTNRLADTTASVYVVPDFSPFNLLNSRWMTINDIPLVSIHESPFMQYYSVEDFLKRMLDITTSLGILTVFAIPMIIIAIGIKQSSPGPIIFRQLRYGIDGNKITIWKFRTMNVCESGEQSVQAKKNDPRITCLGHYLRKYSLDELPQLFNVLGGSMAIVGPRPHSVARNEQYRKRIQGYMLRHKVKPGITGWAQICGLRGETETLDKMEKRFQYDLRYMENWSLTLDLKIMFLTVIRRAWIERPM